MEMRREAYVVSGALHHLRFAEVPTSLEEVFISLMTQSQEAGARC